MEFDEDVYQSRQVLGVPEEPRIVGLYQKLGFSEKLSLIHI